MVDIVNDADQFGAHYLEGDGHEIHITTNVSTPFWF